MLDSLRRRMCKDSPLKLNIDTGGAEEREGKARLSKLPKSFGNDCGYVVG